MDSVIGRLTEIEDAASAIVAHAQEQKAELGYTDMWTYKEEMKARFIMGKDDIDEYWDTYIQTLKDMGIDDVLAIEQAKYDRYVEAQGSIE